MYANDNDTDSYFIRGGTLKTTTKTDEEMKNGEYVTVSLLCSANEINLANVYVVCVRVSARSNKVYTTFNQMFLIWKAI